MHHRGADKLERMATERKRIAFFNSLRLGRCRQRHELRQQGKSLRGCNESRLRVLRHEISNAAGVVRFQVVNHQVVRLAASESRFQVGKPLAHLVCIDRIRHGNLLVHNHIRIVRHALGHHVLALEQVQVAVVYADILDIFAKVLHGFLLFPSQIFIVRNEMYIF